MRLNMEQYPISFWNVAHMDKVENTPAARVADWKDLGITLAMSPSFDPDYKEVAKAYLDECDKAGLKLILTDRRTHGRYLTQHGEAAYRAAFRAALADFDGHPALFGFFVGDEPAAENIEDAKTAMRIQTEEAPHLIPYLNLLPWFDWIKERISADTLDGYLDSVVADGKAQLLSYDFYAQMQEEGDRRFDMYYQNLYGYTKAYKRTGVPFMSIVLSGAHSTDGAHYRVPTKDDLRWQLGSCVAMGAASVSWYVIDPCGIYEDAGHLYDYRDLPINALGERTEFYDRLSEVNRMFLKHMGDVMHNLTFDECYQAVKYYGGVPAFVPFAKVVEVEADAPVMVSRFHDKDGNEYYLFLCNSVTDSAYVYATFEDGTNLSHCAWGNRFVKTGMKAVADGKQVQFGLHPGQLHLFRVDK